MDDWSQECSLSSYGMSNASISRQREEPVNAVLSYPESIQENNLTRLNIGNDTEWVLKYEMEGETLVCKSFEKNVANLVTEFSFLSQEKHPNIVKSVKEPKEIKFNNQYKMYFFMEHLEFGGLDSYMRNKTTNGCNNGHLMTVEDATNIIVGACRALHYVHSKGYVHADICTDNFFAFRNPKNGLLEVKLGDFESVYRPPTRNPKRTRTTARCTAPEFILDEARDESGNVIQKDPFKDDVWGLALVMWEIQSWIMCKNNISSSKSDEQPGGTVPAQSSIMASASRYIRSRFNHNYDYTCRSQVHVALFQKINNVNPTKAVKSVKPDMILMKEFYEKIHPHNIGYPPMDPKLDSKFGWPITNLIKKCLRINSTTRLSMKEVLEYLLKHAESSPLFRYKTDLESDLNAIKTFLDLDIEDADDKPIDLNDADYNQIMFSPKTLQPNLGQLYRV